MSYNHEEQRDCLGEIHNILDKHEFLKKMHISLGTLLGAVRQGKLNTSLANNNWDDLDFSVTEEHFEEFKEVIIPELLKIGFHIKYVWMTSYGKVGEVTLYRGNDRLDVNQLFPVKKGEDRYYVHHHWYGTTQLNKGLKADYYEVIKPIILEGLSFYGPRECEDYLKDMYGESWRTPCTSQGDYRYWEDTPGIPWWSREHYYNILKELP